MVKPFPLFSSRPLRYPSGPDRVERITGWMLIQDPAALVYSPEEKRPFYDIMPAHKYDLRRQPFVVQDAAKLQLQSS